MEYAILYLTFVTASCAHPIFNEQEQLKALFRTAGISTGTNSGDESTEKIVLVSTLRYYIQLNNVYSIK